MLCTKLFNPIKLKEQKDFHSFFMLNYSNLTLHSQNVSKKIELFLAVDLYFYKKIIDFSTILV
jgi:hypothetical protein